MGFTIFVSKKKVKEWKEKQQFKKALVYLEAVVKKHSTKAGFGAWFKDDKSLKSLLDEIKSCRVQQCIEKASDLIKDESDASGQRFKPLEKESLGAYKEARLLLEEAETIQSTSEARVLLQKVQRDINVIQVYANGQKHFIGKCINSAEQCFKEISDSHLKAREKLEEIESRLNACRNLKQKVLQDVSKRDFPTARKGLDDLFRINKEDENYYELLAQVKAKERADELVSEARKKSKSKNIETLYAGLEGLNEAKKLDPDYDVIKEIKDDLKTGIASIKYDEGVRFKDKEKDILKAIDAFKETDALDISYKDANEIFTQLSATEKEIAAFYDQGVSYGKDLEKAIASFQRAKGFGYKYKDLDEKLLTCENNLTQCNDLISEAKELIQPEAIDYENAIIKLQEAILLYPTYQKATELLKNVQNKKRLHDHLQKAKTYLGLENFRYKMALKEIEKALEIEPHNAGTLSLKQKINDKTLEWLAGQIDDPKNTKKVTTIIRLINAVEKDVPISNEIEIELKKLKEIEAEARKLYQDGQGKLNQARGSNVKAEEPRKSLYAEAGKLFQGALSANNDLKVTIEPVLKDLKKELEEWRVYLESWRLFENEEYEKCLEALQPYKDNPVFEKTSSLIVDALNRLGFSGSFSLTIEGKTYNLIPDDTVNVGRNTDTFKENQITLKLVDISRKHGRITRSGGQYFYEDRGATHGTMINDQKIDRKVELKNRDIIGYGFFIDEDGSPTNELPATCLKSSLYSSDIRPTLKITCELVEHEEFCEDTSKAYILIGDKITIGSGKGGAIAVKDSSISKEHIAIYHEENRYWIEDLGTPGGSFVNDEPLVDKRTLQLGDKIKIGNVEMTVDDVIRI